MSNGDFLWQLLLVLNLVTSVVVGIVSLRRRPPIAEELIAKYATKEELRSAIQAIECRCGEERTSRARIYEKIEEVRKEFNNAIRLIERAVGAIEGAIGTMKKGPQ